MVAPYVADAPAVRCSSFFLIMSGEIFSLRAVDSGTASLLENMAILFVPLLESAIGRRPVRRRCLQCGGGAWRRC